MCTPHPSSSARPEPSSTSKGSRSIARASAFVLAALPPTVLAILIATWGVDLPYWDQWALVPHLEKAAEGELPLADLWRQHNEHRLFFPQAIMLALAQLTDWNIRVEMALSLLLASLCFLTLVWLARQTSPSLPTWIWPVLSLLIFSPSQWENWLWGWQIQIFLNVLMVVLGLALLVRAESWGRLLGGAACGIVATFSFANGLLFWGLGLPLVLRAEGRRGLRVAAWVSITTAVVMLYFHDYGFAEREPFFAEGLARTLKLFGGYVSIYLGAPIFAFEGHWALYGGFMVLVGLGFFFAMEARNRPIEWLLGPRLPWLLIASYAGVSALVTASGRLRFGIGQALTSRYITISSLFFVAVVVLIALHPPIVGRPARRLAGVVAVALVGGLLISAGYGISRTRAVAEERGEVLRALRTDPNGAELLRVYPNEAEARRFANTLESLSMGPYRRP